MPLSEHEQHLLEEMERGLYHNDSDFVSTVGPHRGRPSYRTIVIGALIGILGVAVIVTGVVLHQPIVGVAGFVVMFGGVLVAISVPKRVEDAEAPKGGSGNRAGFMDRMNERWDRRQDNRDE